MQLLTVILPTYNRKHFLRQAILSLLAERLPAIEILVIDDGSTDGTSEGLLGLDIRLIRLPMNTGVSRARNVGLKEARGEYIAFLDSDDLLVPGSLRWRLEWLQNRLEENVIGGMVEGRIDEVGLPLCLKPHLQCGLEPPSRLSFEAAKQGSDFSPSMALYLSRKTFLMRVGLFNESLKIGEDREYFLRMLKNCTDIPIERKPVFLRRIHKNNLSIQITEEGDIQAKKESRKDIAIRYLALTSLFST